MPDGLQSESEADHFLAAGNNASSAFEASEPMSGTSIITFHATGTGFALNEPLLWDNLAVSVPMVSAIQIRMKSLLDSLVQPLKSEHISATQFPIQELSGFIIDRFPNPELMRFFEENATAHPTPPRKLAFD